MRKIYKYDTIFVGIGIKGANNSGHKGVHIVKAEKALGRYIPDKAEVHHLDGDSRNNENNNIVICENRAYHKLLHRRLRAYEATGNPNMAVCGICKKWDFPENLYIKENKKNGPTIRHRKCGAKKERLRKKALREKLNIQRN